MSKLNFPAILNEVTNKAEFIRWMKTAERDWFYKSNDFIDAFRDAIDKNIKSLQNELKSNLNNFDALEYRAKTNQLSPSAFIGDETGIIDFNEQVKEYNKQQLLKVRAERKNCSIENVSVNINGRRVSMQTVRNWLQIIEEVETENLSNTTYNPEEQSIENIIKIELHRVRSRFTSPKACDIAIKETIKFFQENTYRSTTQIKETLKAKDAVIIAMKQIKVNTGRIIEFSYKSDTDYLEFIKSLFFMYKNDTLKQLGERMEKKS